MPCDSTITRTTMTGATRIAEAMTALGYTTQQTPNAVIGHKGGSQIAFTRGREGQPFSTTAYDVDAVKAVQRKYSELGLRAAAKRAGYTVSKWDEATGELHVVNRRRG